MKRIFFSLFLFLACSGAIRAQVGAQQTSTTDQIAKIRRQYAAIDSRSKRFDVRRREIAEGNSVMIYTGYYDKGVIRKITVQSSGERDTYVTHFYLQDDTVFFVHQITTRFKSIADNNGVRSEERFYFAGNKLIRNLGNKNAVRPVDDAEARSVVKELSALRQEAIQILSKSRG